MRLCFYGCNREGKHQLENGRWCCEFSFQKCLALRKKNSVGLKLSYDSGRRKIVLHHKSWNKGLTKGTDERVLRNSRAMSVSMKGKPGRPHYEETKEKLRKLAIENNYEEFITRRRRDFPYNKDGKVINLQSSYELETAKDLDRNHIDWNRPSSFYYIDKNGTRRKYFPDFYLKDFKIYIDTKNDYLAVKDKEKISLAAEQNNVRILIVTKENLKWTKIKSLIKSVAR